MHNNFINKENIMNLVPFQSDLLPSRSSLWDRDFLSLRNEMDNLMNNFFTQGSFNRPLIRSMGYFPAVDIQEKDGKYLLEAELPGMAEDEIDLDLHDNILTLKGERKSEFKEEKEGYYHAERSLGTFRRDIPFNEQVDPDKVKAELKNGILHIEVAKREDDGKAHKKIKIKH